MADPAEPDRREAIWISRVVANDDHEAFASLVRLHQSAVRGFLRRLTADLPGDDASLVLAARRTFDELMEQLHPAERAAVVLHYRHACTHAEIADTLHVPLGTVKTLIRRARIRLQQAHSAPIER